MKAPSRCPLTFTLLLLLLPPLLAAGCEQAAPPARAEQTGTLSDLSFTVRAGRLRQERPDGPIAVGRDGVLLVFDEPVGRLAPDEDNLRITAIAEFAVGGTVVIGAWGDERLRGAVGVGAERQGKGFAYAFRHGFAEGADQTGLFRDRPAEPEEALYLRTEFRREPTVQLWAWSPWDTIPADCTAGPVGDAARAGADQAQGERLGLWLRDVTLHGVSILWPSYEGC